MLALFKLGIVVLVGLLIECAMIFVQVRNGRSLPFKAKLIPTFEGV